jgi:hypothetical protein
MKGDVKRKTSPWTGKPEIFGGLSSRLCPECAGSVATMIEKEPFIDARTHGQKCSDGDVYPLLGSPLAGYRWLFTSLA